jgi:hypothetical protein
MELASREKGPSWLERAYHESTIGDDNTQLLAPTPDLVVKYR